jgi:hypothetical protein
MINEHHTAPFCMQASINKVFLLGEIGRDGVEVRYTDKGTPHAGFLLVLGELGATLVKVTVTLEKAVRGPFAQFLGHVSGVLAALQLDRHVVRPPELQSHDVPTRRRLRHAHPIEFHVGTLLRGDSN